MIIAADHVVTPSGVLRPGWVRVAGPVIEAVGAGAPPGGAARDARADLHGAWALPGFVDMHVHGGGGASFTEGDADAVRAAVAFHRRHGTTAIIASLVTAPAGELASRASMLAGLADQGVIDGIHLEGPFLSVARCGAQDPHSILPGDPDLLRRLLHAAGGAVRSMTLAPETSRLGEVLDVLAASHVTPSYGHTDASAAVTRAAIDAAGGGPLGATHLFNAMPPLHHRAPGPAGACLAAAARGAMVVELIGDGLHLAEDTVAMVFALIGPNSIALVTDAMAAAGMPDGRYPFGPMTVDVVDSVARLATDDGTEGAIAGGTARLIDVLRRTVLEAGVPLPDAVTAATATPARLIGLDAEVGDVVPGRRADLLITDDDLMPRAVMRAGRWVHGALFEEVH